jgi:hypothetical protein
MEKYQIENIDLGLDGTTPVAYIECYNGFSKQYFLREILNFLKKEGLIKSYEVGDYKGELYGEVDKIHIIDKGLDSEVKSIETIPVFEYIDENYDDVEWFLDQRSLSLKN